jgi:site-specific DNA recombinase
LNVLLSVAQWERDAIGERTRDALQLKIRNGQRCGKVRFGYDLARDVRTLVPNRAEQAALALIIQLRAAGESFRAIAAELNRRGIATKEGRPWRFTTIQGILSRVAGTKLNGRARDQFTSLHLGRHHVSGCHRR